jgi:hypothetical protein
MSPEKRRSKLTLVVTNAILLITIPIIGLVGLMIALASNQ